MTGTGAFPPGHYYSPIPDMAEAQAARTVERDMTLPGIDLATPWSGRPLIADIPWTDEPQPGLRYSYNDGGKNVFFGKADAHALYYMVRSMQPSRVIEVGCGYSSAALLDTVEHTFGSWTQCTFIDPEPARLINLLKGPEPVTIVDRKVQDLPVSIFQALEADDILFIDSSHVVKAGSDVQYLLFDVLPALASGVYIHFHDIWFPFDYPREWLTKGIFFNESYVLHALLMHNSAYQIVYWADWIHLFHEGPPGGSSLWLRKR